MKQLNVNFLPSLMNPHETAGRTVIVIDVLRASTTICFALDAGAKYVAPCLEVNEALNTAERLTDQGETTLLGGERGGKRVPSFDLGNSPLEYTASRVGGRVVCFSTTNGTKAMMRCVGAGRVFVGTFVNLASVLLAVEEDDEVELLCAGTNGTITREDVLFAGAFVARALEQDSAIGLNDEARLARDAWGLLTVKDNALATEFRETTGGKNLLALGYDRDLEVAAEIDCLNVVPELDLGDWQIRLR